MTMSSRSQRVLLASILSGFVPISLAQQPPATIEWVLIGAGAAEPVPMFAQSGLAVLSITLLLLGMRMLKRQRGKLLSSLLVLVGLAGAVQYSPSLVQTAQAIIPVVELDVSPKPLLSGDNQVQNIQAGPIRITGLVDGSCAIDQSMAASPCQVGDEIAAGATCNVFVDCTPPAVTGFVVGSMAVVSADGIDGTGTIDFRCAEWEGNVCIRPQSRVPSSTCATYEDADVWHDMTYFNSSNSRNCPSVCAAVTTTGTVIECAGGVTTATSTANGNVSTSYSASTTGCVDSTDARWRNDFTGQTGNYNIRHSTYGAGSPRLRLECDWD